MNTPESGRRTATPRLSERKRQLFKSRTSLLEQIDDDADVDDELLLGISPLKPRHQHENIGARKQRNVRSLFAKGTNVAAHGLRLRSSTSSSPETNKENKSAAKARAPRTTTGTTEEAALPDLFTTTMRIDSNSGTSQSSSPRTPKTRRTAVSEQSSSDRGDAAGSGSDERRGVKRDLDDTLIIDVETCSPESPVAEPECKLRRTHEECIPTVAFYSHASKSRADLRGGLKCTPNSQRRRRRIVKGNSPTSRPRLGINKGVGHKIRKPTSHPSSSTDLDGILGMLRNEKLRNLITTKREERAKVEQVHQILRSAQDPIKMAKPLSVMAQDNNNNNDNSSHNSRNISAVSCDFSDLSDDDEEQLAPSVAMELEPVIPLIRHGDAVQTSPPADTQPAGKRKFFKSGRRSSTCMEVRITDNIRASVSQGRIQLVEAPLRKRQVRVKSATIFSAEQATVDAILRNLDDTVVDEIVESQPLAARPPTESAVAPVAEPAAYPAVEPETLTEAMPATQPQSEPEQLQEMEHDPYAKYRQLLPYKTQDPAMVEQQELLLEFLISNNICTDENFEIFIADPDNHKEEATRIVDQLYMVVNAELAAQQAQLEEPIAMPELPATAIEPSQSDGPAGKLFPIFTQRLLPIPQQCSTRRRVSASKQLMLGAAGQNQYQIDAGQKAFGARQCQQCGLVYTVHEPEEEQLHREYHSAVHVLRFKGWIDEDIVAVHPTWSADGRIIRITEQAPAARLQRLNELIAIVDKELGYSSYIVPKTFVVFFAVRKQQIVGMCLVQPLTRAHRYIQVDGADYLSEESFEASCGISRIWVSPLHRRQGIATQLLRTMQLHTVLGTHISRDRIAFSAPTDEGRALARHFTQNDNFLTYSQ
ncbi:hypothetical protein KR222_009108 [Zaprionus bogoriensis]|nr:hypothetical protein KR222_009108 [Zaprionus bogoriensis]